MNEEIIENIKKLKEIIDKNNLDEQTKKELENIYSVFKKKFLEYKIPEDFGILYLD